VDGQDALKHLDGSKLDLIITDLHMPNMDGIEFIRNVRAKDDYKFVPILFLTTESQTAKKMEAKDAGATGWIIKPFVPEKLLAAINKVVR
jgi:two-component system chemotaxis response regulator CheY